MCSSIQSYSREVLRRRASTNGWMNHEMMKVVDLFRRSLSSSSSEKAFTDTSSSSSQTPHTPSIKSTASNSNNTPKMDLQKAYSLLKLSKFTKAEIDWRFDRIVQAGGGDGGHHQPAASIIMHRATGRGATSPSYQFDKLPSTVLKDAQHTQQQQQRMNIQDLEAYIFQRYLIMEDQWNKDNKTDLELGITSYSDDDNDDVKDGPNQMKRQLGKALEIHKQQSRRIEQIQSYAERDAGEIIGLLLPHVPLDESQDDHNTPSTSSRNKSHHPTPSLSKHQFHTAIHALSTKVQYHTILPLAASMLLVGSSVGVISPIMPFVATKLQLSSSQYGIVVSSFALSKMLGNVPSAILVERHGRKPYLVHSLWLVGFGVMGLGLSNDWIQLSACRMTIGLGVAALTTASTLTVADVSTPLSRASTFSPVMSAFAAGTALGPALGGILCDEYGIRDTFLMVGASYGVLALWNNVSLKETGKKEWWESGDGLPWREEEEDKLNGTGRVVKSSKKEVTTTISQAVKNTTQEWSNLMKDPKVSPIVVMNGFYLCAISGTQMTLLPLLLTGGGGATAGAAGAATGMALTATAMGQIYMWMSAVQVIGNPAAGRFADRKGKETAIIAGGVLTSAAMATVPVICAYGLMVGDFVALDVNDVNWPLLAATLGVWSLGSTLLATSHVSDKSERCTEGV